MAYVSKNPRFDSTILTDQGVNSVANAATGTYRIVVRSGVAFLQDSSGTEVAISSGAGGFMGINNLELSCSVSSSALTIALKNGAGSDPSSGSPCEVSFRSATEATGDYTVRTATAATSLVISSGSTLGHISASSSPIFVYLIDNAGTLELAASSAYFDENRVQSSTAEGGAGAATSASVLYSTTARTNKAIRYIGKLLSNQTTAGTWAAVPQVVMLTNKEQPGQSEVVLDTGNGEGSTNTRVRRFTNIQKNTGTAFKVTQSSTAGDSITILEPGVYGMSYTDRDNSATQNMGISLNSSQLTTAIGSITTADRLAMSSTIAGDYGHVSCTALLKTGDVIRAHVGASLDNVGASVQFRICQISKF